MSNLKKKISLININRVMLTNVNSSDGSKWQQWDLEGYMIDDFFQIFIVSRSTEILI